MADQIKITPEQKKAANLAWHDADTDEKKAAAVKKYPFLVEHYALALNFVKPADITATNQPQPQK